jgi:hypothetical protein
MRVDFDGWKTIMRLGPKGVLGKVWYAFKKKIS